MTVFQRAFASLRADIEQQGYTVVTLPGTSMWQGFMAEVGAERFPAFTVGHDAEIDERTCLSICVQHEGRPVAGIAARRYAVGNFERWLASGRMFFGPVECLEKDFGFEPPTHDSKGYPWPEIWGGVHVRGGNFVIPAHRGKGIGSRLSMMALAAAFQAFPNTDHSIGLRHRPEDVTVERITDKPVFKGLDIGKAEADFWLTHTDYAEAVEECDRILRDAGAGDMGDMPIPAHRWHA